MREEVSEAGVWAGPAPCAASGPRSARNCAACMSANVQPLTVQPNRAPDNVQPLAVARYPGRDRASGAVWDARWRPVNVEPQAVQRYPERHSVEPLAVARLRGWMRHTCRPVEDQMSAIGPQVCRSRVAAGRCRTAATSSGPNEVSAVRQRRTTPLPEPAPGPDPASLTLSRVVGRRTVLSGAARRALPR